jgi:hypothetical protein
MINGLGGENDISGTKVAQTSRMTRNDIEVMQNMERMLFPPQYFTSFGKK